jgi:hypothetical protein
MFKDIRKVLLAAMMASLLAGCGGGGGLSGDGTGDGDGDGSGDGDGDGTTQTFRAGRLVGDNFTSGALEIGVETLSASGQTAVAVDIVDSNGARALGTSAEVLFSSDCVVRGSSRFTTDSVTTTNGRGSTTYIAQGCQGTDTITARATIDGQTLAATGTITVAPASAGVVKFLTSDRAVIGIQGGPATQQAQLTYQVFAQGGGGLQGQTVSFALVGDVPAGATITPSSAVSDAEGKVRVTLQSGSQAGPVTVRASLPSGPSASQSIVISVGYADSDSVSLSADKLSLDANCDGEPSNITVRLADRNNNPVPENTPAAFTSSGGKVGTSCPTGDPFADPTEEAGACTVLFTVQEFRPPSGRVVVTVEVDGEESFGDLNKDGSFDAGEPFDDVNGNGRYDGYVCDSVGQNCVANLVKLRDTLDIVFSTADADLRSLVVAVDSDDGDFVAGILTLTEPEAPVGVTVIVKDTNGNRLPAGFTLTLRSDVGTVNAPATIGPFNGNDSSDVANTFSFGYKGPEGDEGDRGQVALDVKLPATKCRGELTETIPLFNVDYDPPVAPAP